MLSIRTHVWCKYFLLFFLLYIINVYIIYSNTIIINTLLLKIVVSIWLFYCLSRYYYLNSSSTYPIYISYLSATKTSFLKIIVAYHDMYYYKYSKDYSILHIPYSHIHDMYSKRLQFYSKNIIVIAIRFSLKISLEPLGFLYHFYI